MTNLIEVRDLAKTFTLHQQHGIRLQVLRRNPRDPTLITQYANFAWNVLHDRPLAIRAAREAVAISPAATYRLALAKFLLADGQGQEGRALVAALKARPGDVAPGELHALDTLAKSARPTPRIPRIPDEAP